MRPNEEVPRNKYVEDEKGLVQKPVLEMGRRTMHYTRAPGNFYSAPRWKSIFLSSVDEIAENLWRTGLRHTEMLEHSKHQTVGCIPSCQLPWTNNMNNIPRLQWFEVGY